MVQLDVFDEEKANDDEQLPGVAGVDLNSHLDIFNAIFKQVDTRETWAAFPKESYDKS